ncbi:ATP-dependent DNA helicase mph1 [Metarhizium album ARSEF 1941]|uniref:ATP-dependent DNA helicase n=1 Tax=Metarhizium album (strain ARSEF 1941) TaxID=1081103 RepID=A0A0B2WV59_METAS|nr:ATP-dependent DNA helicase mph1 [Metarhizium album ARSEF 1941]KHN99996.1 ATP-dependent DNA helicase mph1 [Metarhizium album ARSEF 1941]
MDGDEFGEDFVDEDFLELLDQVSSSNMTRPLSQPSSNGVRFANDTRTKPNPLAAAVQELEDLPSDAFSSPEPEQSASVTASPASRNASNGPRARGGLKRTASAGLRQTTLWGREVREDAPFHSPAPAQRIFRADLPHEEPTHHDIDKKAMETWVYPMNLGAIRDYQFSIVKNSLFNNTLVALPTGLGKTFIAATVMLNFYRWTTSAKIVFVAPTKPLAAQQIDACYNIVGIPRSDTTLLTGDIQPALRADEWAKRRVFFMTPQTLLNDLSHGYADPKSIALLVIDEAHRAVGEYAYAKATKLMRRFHRSFRVLALTATPGSKIETVQEVIDNLGISHCEIRTEESIDIRQYVHQRTIEQMVLDPSDEMNLVGELFTEALKPLVDRLGSQNIYYGRNPMAMNAYGLMQAQKEWFATRGRHANQGVQFMMRAIFGVLTSLAHSIKLLNFHGIRPFYDNMADFRSEQEGKGEKGSKYKRQLIEHPSFQKMMDHISRWLKTEGFVGHPKLAALADCVLNHFMDQGEGSTTRVIVFSEYRDSAEDIVRELNKHQPLLKASVFVGQADGKRGEGMKQAQQIQTIERFRKGEFNVLVATSIGEEGLDIGQVDLIVCYDSSASPVRMLQRMGRTGRKRAGNIVLLLMRGKEEDQFAKSKDSYEKMQKLICEGSRFNFRFDLSTRIVPREIRPEVEKKFVEIPIENTQNQSLPEPKKRRPAAGKKKPLKKFHMPDGVETGFQKLSYYMKDGSKPERSEIQRNPELDDLESIPDLSSVVLTEDDLEELDRSYRDLPFNHSVVEETDMPSMTAFPILQRQLRPVANLKHGTCTRRFVKLLAKMGAEPESLIRQCRSTDTSRFREIPVRPFVQTDGESEGDEMPDLETRKQSTSRRSVRVDAEGPQPPRRKKRRISTTSVTEPSGSEDNGNNRIPGRESKRTKTSKGGRKGTTKQRGGISSYELGDDCERDSDQVESSGSDDGTDLLGFVVTDNQATSSMVDSQATSPTTASAQSTPKTESEKPFYVPTRFSATQESDDMPDLTALVGRKVSDKVNPKDPASDWDLEYPTTKHPARGGRRVIDSDSEA